MVRRPEAEPGGQDPSSAAQGSPERAPSVDANPFSLGLKAVMCLASGHQAVVAGSRKCDLARFCGVDIPPKAISAAEMNWWLGREAPIGSSTPLQRWRTGRWLVLKT